VSETPQKCQHPLIDWAHTTIEDDQEISFIAKLSCATTACDLDTRVSNGRQIP
jgi:hypothetical protein